ncbi:MAG: cytidine deaminase [Lactobacillaceae bacterium]|jgi:cytidine deaminase|nr:cytidine deaminase [Lactobacillaceae bacterium]
MKIAEKLFNLALEARKRSYSPYSKFKVGAAIYADDEKFYSSCNVENVSYPCGTCAETGAISSMIAGGGKKIKEILVVADSENIISPCGGCRQRIMEFSDKNTYVHLAGLDGIKKTMKAHELLPLAFDEEELRND